MGVVHIIHILIVYITYVGHLLVCYSCLPFYSVYSALCFIISVQSVTCHGNACDCPQVVWHASSAQRGIHYSMTVHIPYKLSCVCMLHYIK